MMNNKLLKQLTILIACAMAILPARAQETRSITLNEAIDLSLQNSKQLKLNQAKIAEATASLREARERRLPDLSVTGTYMRLSKPTLDLKLKLGSSGSGQENSGSGSSSGSSSGSASSITVNEAAYAMANLSLPLFSGFRIQHGIEAAKYLERAAQLDAENNREDVIQNTIAAYSNMYKAKSALDIVRQNLVEAQQRVTDLSNLEKNGLLARNDLLDAELRQSNVELALLDAENNWKITYITMNLMLGLPEQTELAPDSTSFATIADAGTFEEWETRALQNRKDIAAIEMRRQAADANIKAARGEYYPSLALTGGYIAANVPNVLTLTNAITAGVGLSYSPSSLWKTGSKVAQAKARLQQVEVNESLLDDNVRLQVAQAYEAYLSAQKKIDVYSKAVEQANENYRIVQNKYNNALATTTDLLDADLKRLQAQINYAYSKADASVAYNKLLQTTGTLNFNQSKQ